MQYVPCPPYKGNAGILKQAQCANQNLVVLLTCADFGNTIGIRHVYVRTLENSAAGNVPILVRVLVCRTGLYGSVRPDKM